MKYRYAKYTDLLTFDIIHDHLSNLGYAGRCYQVGVIAVIDTNAKVLLAGVTILADQSSDTVYRVLLNFIILHGKTL
jgi:hypothetical protein